VRDWDGVTDQVQVPEDGLLFRGKRFISVRSATKASAIPASTKRSWIEKGARRLSYDSPMTCAWLKNATNKTPPKVLPIAVGTRKVAKPFHESMPLAIR
jgi:hypothetical protein